MMFLCDTHDAEMPLCNCLSSSNSALTRSCAMFQHLQCKFVSSSCSIEWGPDRNPSPLHGPLHGRVSVCAIAIYFHFDKCLDAAIFEQHISTGFGIENEVHGKKQY